MTEQALIPHLFRTEFSKIVSVLCKQLGVAHLELAEDIASETFLAAMEQWPYHGQPPNPAAWLYTVAKNKAFNVVQRRRVFANKIIPALSVPAGEEAASDVDLSAENIADSQLRMMFAVCHPVLPVEAQVGLTLRILCGFGIDEIATAFLTNRETINKRLFRAREKLRQENVLIEMPAPQQVAQRLDAVLTTIYLLFNEGYYSESHDTVLREDLCLEAMRLTHLLIENPTTNLPTVNAMMALMCFHASRFKARKNEAGEMILYDDQDEALWNNDLIAQGAYFLKQASQGDNLSRYHLHAGIAYWHTHKTGQSEKWENILTLYNQLLQLEYSPVAALNRTYALSRARGKAAAIEQAEKLQLTDNHYYFLLLGELYAGIDDKKSRMHLETALSLARTESDKNTIRRRIVRI